MSILINFFSVQQNLHGRMGGLEQKRPRNVKFLWQNQILGLDFSCRISLRFKPYCIIKGHPLPTHAAVKNPASKPNRKQSKDNQSNP